jgi:hypothetical protein
MAEEEKCLELFDIPNNASIGTVPLANVTHMPRKGERIFLRNQQAGDWTSYAVVEVEYFMGTTEDSQVDPGTVRVVLYAEPSKSSFGRK